MTLMKIMRLLDMIDKVGQNLHPKVVLPSEMYILLQLDLIVQFGLVLITVSSAIMRKHL